MRQELVDANVLDAIVSHDTPVLFDWLMNVFSYQGISDTVARGYIERNGNATWHFIQGSLPSSPCSRLRSYWQFADCRYDKTSFTCAEPDCIEACGLPRQQLRNGKLNRTAYSFYFFLRDICKGDLVSWIDHRLAMHSAQEGLLEPLRNVFGISDKILTMALSGLLLGCAEERPNWFAAGKDMMAIDSLVHNHFVRTGILNDCGKPHTFGPACYAPGGCAEIIRHVSSTIDARNFNPDFPKNFPRFVQNAIWQFCAAEGLNICNGVRVNDRFACKISFCSLTPFCAKKPLKPQ